MAAENRPAKRPATAADVTEGLAIWAAYESGRRALRVGAKALKVTRRAVFGWREYSKYLRDQSLVEGFRNGRKIWIAVGAVTWGSYALRKAIGRSERVVMREVLQPGERVVITQLPVRQPRSARRAAKRAG